MAEVSIDKNDRGHIGFNLIENGAKIGEMVGGLSSTSLTVYHTEVDSGHEGKGFAKLLLEAMVKYAREHHLKVVPLCPYVHAQFKKHPDIYADIWEKS